MSSCDPDSPKFIVHAQNPWPAKNGPAFLGSPIDLSVLIEKGWHEERTLTEPGRALNWKL